VSDIDIAVADSLKVLDPNRPIREADIVRCSWHRRGERHLPGFPQPSATVCLFHCFIALTRGTRSRRNSVLLVNRLDAATVKHNLLHEKELFAALDTIAAEY
jgi:hypothetical protein